MITIMGKNIIGDFTTEDWANTPESVKRAVFEVNDLYFELLKKNEQLEQNFIKVEGQLKKDSSNSSKPPSSDSPYRKRYASNKNKTARKGKAGAL